jgi:hypothetical protein
LQGREREGPKKVLFNNNKKVPGNLWAGVWKLSSLDGLAVTWLYFMEFRRI